MIYSLKTIGKIGGYYDFTNKIFKSGLDIKFKPGVNIIIGKMALAKQHCWI